MKKYKIDYLIKLGGSVVTEKEVEERVDYLSLNHIAEELSEYQDKKIVLVHGAGGFGHPVAKKYKIHLGYQGENQRIGFCFTHFSMVTLNKEIVKILLQHSIPAISVPTYLLARMENKRLIRLDKEPLVKILKEKMVPVIYGDVAFDEKLRWSICSGDQIIRYIAMEFDVGGVILCSDVDGVFSDDPKNNPEAEFYREIKSLENLNLGIGFQNDITGGMYGKLLELLKLPVNSRIINGKVRGNLRRAMAGEQIGTLIRVD